MSDDKAKELEKDISDINVKLDNLQKDFALMFNLMKSNAELKTVGYSEQQKINTKDISQLKIDKKILLGIGAVIGSLLSAGVWLFTRVKSILV
jgi:hypothetical protein